MTSQRIDLISMRHLSGRELPTSIFGRRKQENQGRRIPIRLLGALVAAITVFGFDLQSASADSGRISLKVYKAGWIIGGSGGSGTLTFRGRTYRLGVGGVDYGLVFGGSKTVLHGRVSHIRRASDVEGVYGAAGAGLAVGRGTRAIVLTKSQSF